MNKKPKIAIIGLSGESIFMSVNHFHQNGETIIANNIHKEPGGKGYNQAIAVSRLGGEAHFFSVVGDDDYGHYCHQQLKREKVNPYFVFKQQEKTAYATILTDCSGNNQVTVFPGAIKKAESSDFNQFDEVIKKMDVLLLSMEIPYDILKYAINSASKYQVKIILNPAPAIYDIREFQEKISWLTPNEIEAKTIFKNSLSNLDLSLIPNSIITLGGSGALIINNHNSFMVPGTPVEVLDTTGAGDVFNGALAVSLGKNESIKKATIFANQAAAISVTRKYVFSAIPYLKELK